MDKLEWAVDTVDGTTFEKIAGEILRNEGYDVHESGVIGTDGGWDARIVLNGRKGIGHASVDNNWRGKLRNDAESVEELEKEQNESFDHLVFVTNQRVTGQQELDMEEEIEEEYDWDLKILHRRHIIGITGHERPDLAERHFGFNPKRNDDHIDQVLGLRDERLDLISNRKDVASDLEKGPAAVIHLIPNGVFSGNYVQRSDDLPGLPRVGKLNVHPGTESVGKGKLNAGGRLRQPYKSYTYLRKDGLFEAVDTWVFREDEEDGLLLNNARRPKESLDCKIGITVQAGIRALKNMGVTGTAFCFISLLDARGATVSYETRISGPPKQKPLRTEQYTTDLAEIPLEEADVVDSLRNPLTEIWQELGWDVNLHYDEDGDWIGPTVQFAESGQFPADN
ncbi:restriction endonuclease [Natrialba sp. PRR66]|uniref:restriction endonuclease n=1 Tax=Natrialba sp. PRR66 TaxID=3098146 RepID=UPI002B1D8D10|nr:restriction endonuclease [Natrialba sp. PRR66]